MNEFIDRINGMQDGDTVTLSVPIGGGQTVNIEGTVKVESNGKVTITASKAEVPFRNLLSVLICFPHYLNNT